MPELPDITVYVEALEKRVVGRTLRAVRVTSPFLIRSVSPPIETVVGREIVEISRLGKRVVIEFTGDLYLVFHLMIAARFRWAKRGANPPRKIGLAALDFDSGSLLVTEAGTRKRASLHVVSGADQLHVFDRGGLEVLDADLATFQSVLVSENHTLKRALTDPRLFSGIGNAYSDEILHRARLSPIVWTTRLTDEQIERLYHAVRDSLTDWTERLREQFRDRFPGPGDITAFRHGFAVHGRYDKPCPACGTRVQRIRYAENETNYCPKCQSDGKILADRSLSRLLKNDWPQTIEQLEDAVHRGMEPASRASTTTRKPSRNRLG